MWSLGGAGDDKGKKTPWSSGNAPGNFGASNGKEKPFPSSSGWTGSKNDKSEPPFGNESPFGKFQSFSSDFGAQDKRSSAFKGFGKGAVQGSESSLMQKSIRTNPFSVGGDRSSTETTSTFGSSGSSQSKKIGGGLVWGGGKFEGRMRSGGKSPTTLSGKEKVSPSCRVCGSTFASFDDLKGHIRKEGHHSNAKDNLSVSVAPGRGVGISSDRHPTFSVDSGDNLAFAAAKGQRRGKDNTGKPTAQSPGVRKEGRGSSLREEMDMKKNLMAKMSGGPLGGKVGNDKGSSSNSGNYKTKNNPKAVYTKPDSPIGTGIGLTRTGALDAQGVVEPSGSRRKSFLHAAAAPHDEDGEEEEEADDSILNISAASNASKSSIFDRLRTASGDQVSRSVAEAREAATGGVDQGGDSGKIGDEDESENDCDDDKQHAFWSGKGTLVHEDDEDDLASQNLVYSDGDGDDNDINKSVTSAGTRLEHDQDANKNPFSSFAVAAAPLTSLSPAAEGTDMIEQRPRQGSGSARSGGMLDLLKSKMAGQFPMEAARAGVRSSKHIPNNGSQSLDHFTVTENKAMHVQSLSRTVGAGDHFSTPTESASSRQAAASSVTRGGNSSVDINGGGGGAVVPLCEDMCAEAERSRRIESDDLDKFEKPEAGLQLPGHPGSGPEGTYTYKDLMVKKLAKSSADHTLQTPAEMRTPGSLLRVIRYLEQCVMDADSYGPDPRFVDPATGASRPPTFLEIYFYVFSRMRMIAKDFILQSGTDALDDTGGNNESSMAAESHNANDIFVISPVWIEVHERIARYYIICENYMRSSSEYVEDHAQQNGEQLNNVFKTLLQYYVSPASLGFEKPNRAEFTSYFLLGQLGNTGEVAKFLRSASISDEVVHSPQIAFVTEVWGAIKNDDYARFFKLLRKADLLQACMMMKYVGEIRMIAIQRLCTTLCPPGKPTTGNAGTLFSVDELTHLLFFEDRDDCLDFLGHCGVEVNNGDDGSPQCVLKKVNIVDQLPLDKNNHPILPHVRHLARGIDSKRGTMSLRDACRGKCSGARAFNDEDFLRIAVGSQPHSSFLSATAASFIPGARIPLISDPQEGATREKQHQVDLQRQQYEARLAIQQKKETEARRQEEQRARREAALKAAEEAAAEREREKERQKSMAAEAEARMRKAARAEEERRERAVQEERERKAEEARVAAAAAAALAESKRKADEEERQKAEAAEAARREKEEALARERDIQRLEQERAKRVAEERARREKEERKRREEERLRRLQKALESTHRITEKLLLRSHFRHLVSYFEHLKRNRSAEKRIRLLEELRSIDMSTTFASTLNLGSASSPSSPHIDCRLGLGSKRTRAVETIERGMRGPLHHPRQRSITLRYLASPAIISASQAISTNICRKLAPALYDRQTHLLRAVQQDESLSWDGQLNYKIALVTAAHDVRFWSLNHAANFSIDKRLVDGSTICANLLRLVCCTHTAGLSQHNDWTDEEEISAGGDGLEETAADRLAFQVRPSVYRTQVSVASAASEEPPVGPLSGSCRERTASLLSISSVSSSEGGSRLLGSASRGRLRSRKSVSSTKNNSPGLKLHNNKKQQQSCGKFDFSLSIGDTCSPAEGVGADMVVVVVPSDPAATSLGSIAHIVAQVRSASVKNCPIGLIVTTDKPRFGQTTLLATENLDLANPKVVRLTRLLTERSAGTLKEGWQESVFAALELCIDTSALKAPDTPSSNLDNVRCLVDQCDSDALSCLGECVTTLCESVLLTGNMRASTPVIYGVNVMSKLTQLVLPVIQLIGTSTMSSNEENESLQPVHERSIAMEAHILAFREKKEQDDVHMLLHQLAYGNMNDTDPHYSFNSAVISVIERTLDNALNTYNDQATKWAHSLHELASAAERMADAVSVVESGKSLPGAVFSTMGARFTPLPADWSSNERYDSGVVLARSLLLPTYPTHKRGSSQRNVLTNFSATLEEWVKKLSIAHDSIVQAVLNLPCSVVENLLQSRKMALYQQRQNIAKAFHGLLTSSVTALKAENVVNAPYGPHAEACCVHVVRAIYAAVESCMTTLLAGARDLAASAQEEFFVYAASFDDEIPVPRPMHWDRREEEEKLPHVSKKRHYEATLDEGSAKTWTDAKRRTTGDEREVTTPETQGVDSIDDAVKEGVSSEQRAQNRLEQMLKSALGLGVPTVTSWSEEVKRGEGEGDEKENVEYNPRFSIESISSPMPPITGDSTTVAETGQNANALDLIRSCREERLSFEATLYSVPK